MAERLVYAKNHWMDDLPSAELTELRKDPGFEAKYQRRYVKGDIVEVRPDGYWTGENAKGFNKKVFAVVCDEGVAYDDVREQEDPIMIDKTTITKRSKYNVGEVTVGTVTKLSSSAFNAILIDKDPG